ncbi:hypothetical protein MASR2M117_20960 [Paludibacter sp.]
MKRVIYALMVLVLTACYNQEQMFDDNEIQAIYFPFQYPVRTLSLGNDRLDNTLDKQYQFNIGISIGGLYMENRKNWTANFEVDNTLVEDFLVNANGDTLKVLPTAYYSLNPTSSVVIPKGSFSGLIRVQLTDAFFQDPIAIKGNYVIPLKITSSPNDVEILRGEAVEDLVNPNRHVLANWEVIPRDYTLFGIKYVNPYHGSWLRRGRMEEKDASNNFVREVVYRADYVEFDDVVTLTTTALNQVKTRLNVENDKWDIALDVDANKNIVVSTLAGSPVTVSGTGKYVEGGDTWGGTPEKPEPRDVLHLKYSYTRINGNVCEVSDTLVFRDRGIKVEEARPTLK